MIKEKRVMTRKTMFRMGKDLWITNKPTLSCSPYNTLGHTCEEHVQYKLTSDFGRHA
jgi:hypothetical protein